MMCTHLALDGRCTVFGQDCTDTGHCFMTGKCRAKCRKRKHCKFYTTFGNGWCQLSTRCERRAKAGDARAMTFQKTTTIN